MSTPSDFALRRIADVADARFYEPQERLARGSTSAVLDEIFFHAEWRYWQFTPTHAGAYGFKERLLAWLQNAHLEPNEVEILLRTVPHIQFVDRDDMLTLYRSAFLGQIRRWMMDQLSLDFTLSTLELEARLQLGFARTWFCPITDSMDIAQFHHVNSIGGANHRPCWRTLARFGDFQRVHRYMEEHGLERLVLLEDFVGSGTQTAGPLLYAARNLCPKVPVLFVPLIVSEVGLGNLRSKISGVAGLQVEPSFVIPLLVHVTASPVADEPAFIGPLRNVIDRTFEVVREPLPPDSEALKEAFGFGSVGTLLVLYSNCPNNTVPLIWHQAPDWEALFPRVSRA